MEKLSVQDLAMFIGCECRYEVKDNAHYESLSGTGILNSVNLNADNKINFPIVVDDETEVRVEEAKPILRPLSDMTTEEIMELYDMAGYDREEIVAKDYDGQEPIVKRSNELLIRIWHKTSYEYDEWDIYAVHIKQGEIVDYMGYPPNNWQEIFLWFLRKHFDVFGWIEKGLALDKTKL